MLLLTLLYACSSSQLSSKSKTVVTSTSSEPVEQSAEQPIVSSPKEEACVYTYPNATYLLTYLRDLDLSNFKSGGAMDLGACSGKRAYALQASDSFDSLDAMLDFYHSKQAEQLEISHLQFGLSKLPEDIIKLLMDYGVISDPEALANYSGLTCQLGDNLIFIQPSPRKVMDFNQNRYFAGLSRGKLDGRFFIDTKNETVQRYLSPVEFTAYLKACIVHELYHSINSARKQMHLSTVSPINYERAKVSVKLPHYPGIIYTTDSYEDTLAIIDERNAYTLSCKIMKDLGLENTYVYKNDRLIAQEFARKANELIGKAIKQTGEYIPVNDENSIYYINAKGQLIQKSINASTSILYE